MNKKNIELIVQKKSFQEIEIKDLISLIKYLEVIGIIELMNNIMDNEDIQWQKIL